MSDTIKKLTCLRCGYSWFPRTPDRPRVCPNLKCKSPYWDRPRREKKEEEKGGRPNKTKVAQLLDECRNGLSLNNAAKLGYTHAQISAADKIITAALSGEEVEG